jgi:EmrB/QacA subfamily drug resistance transporter
VLGATVLGSGVAFLDGTVVNVALPAIGRDLDASFAGLQWVLDGYLVTLTALIVLGGSLGDLYGHRRMFVLGLVGFSAASLGCAVAPTTATLVGARVLQGVAAALMVPESLAIISASFAEGERGRAIGAWSGLAGVSTALGPFVGGWLIDAVSWRLVFLINLPLTAAAVWLARRYVPETRVENCARPDVRGAALLTAALGLGAFALIERVAIAALPAVLCVVAFVLVEARVRDPMLPLSLFRSRQFRGGNLTTFAVYAALSGALFLVVLELQTVLGYSALEAGTATLPFTLMMLALSAPMGSLAERIGPRAPMTIGPLLCAVGLVLFGRVGAGSTYVTDVLPAVAVFGLGMSVTVAPLTTAVLASVSTEHVGVGSAVNNSVSRLAGLLAVAALPGLAGIDASGSARSVEAGFSEAMGITAAIAAVGGAIAWATIRRAQPAVRTAAPACIGTSSPTAAPS